MPPQAMRSGGYYTFQYVLLPVPRCPDVPCLHEPVRRAGESIIHMQRRRQHVTTHGLQLSSSV